MKTLAEIKADVLELAQRHGMPDRYLPGFGVSRDGGYPHIEVDASHYHYVTVERGRELARLSTGAYGDLLYWVCADITHAMAFAFEGRHRVAGRDARRMAFPHQLELLTRISPAMAERRAREIDAVLAAAPYRDPSPQTPATPA
jgi:hypothetical protein